MVGCLRDEHAELLEIQFAQQIRSEPVDVSCEAAFYPAEYLLDFRVTKDRTVCRDTAVPSWRSAPIASEIA